MIAAPGCTVRTSSWTVSGFMQISTPMSRRRAMKPSFDVRIVNQVGRPWMLEGKRFFPETGMPIWKIALIRMLFEDWLPDPLAVATWIEKSLTMLCGPEPASAGAFSSRTTLKGLSFGPFVPARFETGIITNERVFPARRAQRSGCALADKIQRGGVPNDETCFRPRRRLRGPCGSVAVRRGSVPLRRARESRARGLFLHISRRAVPRLRGRDGGPRREPDAFRHLGDARRGRPGAEADVGGKA